MLHIYNFFSLLPFWSRPSAALTWTIVKSQWLYCVHSCFPPIHALHSAVRVIFSHLIIWLPQLSVSLGDILNSFLVCSASQASGPTVSTSVITSFKTLFRGPKYSVLIFCLGFPYLLFQLPEWSLPHLCLMIPNLSFASWIKYQFLKKSSLEPSAQLLYSHSSFSFPPRAHGWGWVEPWCGPTWSGSGGHAADLGFYGGRSVWCVHSFNPSHNMVFSTYITWLINWLLNSENC